MRRDCFTTCTDPERRTSTPIRTWSPGSAIRTSLNRNAARTGHGTSRRLAGLLAQPLALVTGSSDGKPVWHCSVRAAPEDRMLSDAEWARVAAGVMDRTGLARHGDEFGVRWVAVRHAGRRPPRRGRRALTPAVPSASCPGWKQDLGTGEPGHRQPAPPTTALHKIPASSIYCPAPHPGRSPYPSDPRHRQGSLI
jgi:hypothetical protein